MRVVESLGVGVVPTNLSEAEFREKWQRENGKDHDENVKYPFGFYKMVMTDISWHATDYDEHKVKSIRSNKTKRITSSMIASVVTTNFKCYSMYEDKYIDGSKVDSEGFDFLILVNEQGKISVVSKPVFDRDVRYMYDLDEKKLSKYQSMWLWIDDVEQWRKEKERYERHMNLGWVEGYEGPNGLTREILWLPIKFKRRRDSETYYTCRVPSYLSGKLQINNKEFRVNMSSTPHGAGDIIIFRQEDSVDLEEEPIAVLNDACYSRLFNLNYDVYTMHEIEIEGVQTVEDEDGNTYCIDADGNRMVGLL